jgi:hypothetical protein
VVALVAVGRVVSGSLAGRRRGGDHGDHFLFIGSVGRVLSILGRRKILSIGVSPLVGRYSSGVPPAVLPAPEILVTASAAS